MSVPDGPDPLNPNAFDPDFASPADYALFYRSKGLQVVPCKDKRPDLHKWTELQNELAPEFTFLRWYGPGGEHAVNANMGIITGPCSGWVFVVDLDTHKNPQAGAWWQGLIEAENNGIEPQTVQQRTGGGGIQKLFRAPAGWVVPTNRTPIGVDIRGSRGFAVMPPTRHASGANYAWMPGCAPWEIDIEVAPQWLLDAIEALVGPGSSAENASRETLPASPALPAFGSDYTAFGQRQDGREGYMTQVVWAAITDRYRDSPIEPPFTLSRVWAFEAYQAYERGVVSRFGGPEKGVDLEREGRGLTAFNGKWRAAMRHWGGRVAEAAKTPKPHGANSPQLTPQPEAPRLDPQTGEPLPLVQTAAQFVAGFTPPAYLIDGMVQRGYLYSLTARTGHGKTAVAMYIAQCIARGEPMHGRPVKAGTVLLLAGENPDDIRARFLVLADAFGFDPAKLKMRFVAGVVDIAKRMAEIAAAADTIPDLVLVVVDTAAAYFPGDETNSNSQQGSYARLLRQLTFLNGKPAVIVNCHPIKNAAQENLLPMGGSAFVNEVDGNLTLWANGEKQTSLYWQGKFRGPEFDPMAFELSVCDSAKVIDSDGRLMPNVVAKPISELTLEAGAATLEEHEDRLLRRLYDDPKASFNRLAMNCGFMADGRPQKARVQRIIERLAADKFVVKHRTGKYRLTTKGKAEIGVDEGGQNG